MKFKSTLSILLSTFISTSLLSCTNSKETDISTPPTNEENQTNLPSSENIPPVTKDTIDIDSNKIIEFSAFDKTYPLNKDITNLSNNSVVFDPSNNRYTEGDYAEIDFAKDVLIKYLNEDSSIYDYLLSFDNSSENGVIPVTQEDKDKLQKNLTSLKNEMSFAPTDKVVVIVDKVIYEGMKSDSDKGIILNLRIGISHVGATTAPWVSYTVTVFKDGNKLLANLL